MGKGFSDQQKSCNRKAMQEWTAPDGTRLGWKEWLPATGSPRARVIGLPGMSCCTDDFAPLGETLVTRGIASAAWNLRGQGLDPVIARRGDWLDVEGQLGDLATFANFWARDDLPLFLWGDSMGALLVLQAAVRKRGGTASPECSFSSRWRDSRRKIRRG